MEKVEYIIKKRPQLADQIKIALNSGALDIKSWKDIHSADEDISRVLDDLAKGKIGTGVAEQKCKERIEKLEKAASITKTIFEVGKLAIGLYAAIKFFKSESEKVLALHSPPQFILYSWHFPLASFSSTNLVFPSTPIKSILFPKRTIIYFDVS